ncbi:Hypothetical predicted protein [Lecanosticta acicola]|uniref:Uncharacterized protein n=1 Tax=Lecanosticta acicola TaxID=111012 RepID=A0AAI8Z928_9PEZI|nr:Hypothetical predicted protein [Lecanosticta acicola]
MNSSNAPEHNAGLDPKERRRLHDTIAAMSPQMEEVLQRNQQRAFQKKRRTIWQTASLVWQDFYGWCLDQCISTLAFLHALGTNRWIRAFLSLPLLAIAVLALSYFWFPWPHFQRHQSPPDITQMVLETVRNMSAFQPRLSSTSHQLAHLSVDVGDLLHDIRDGPALFNRDQIIIKLQETPDLLNSTSQGVLAFEPVLGLFIRQNYALAQDLSTQADALIARHQDVSELESLLWRMLNGNIPYLYELSDEHQLVENTVFFLHAFLNATIQHYSTAFSIYTNTSTAAIHLAGVFTLLEDSESQYNRACRLPTALPPCNFFLSFFYLACPRRPTTPLVSECHLSGPPPSYRKRLSTLLARLQSPALLLGQMHSHYHSVQQNLRGLNLSATGFMEQAVENSKKSRRQRKTFLKGKSGILGAAEEVREGLERLVELKRQEEREMKTKRDMPKELMG